MILRVWPSRLAGAVNAPASKSVMQRLIAGALLAEGTTTIHNVSDSDDCTAALAMAAQLGADIELGESSVRITGHGLPLKNRSNTLNAGESGLAARLFATIATCASGPMRLEANGTLQSRPMDALKAPIEALGGTFTSTEGHCPLSISGPLMGGEIELDGSMSSQHLTGLLMALPTADTDSLITVHHLVSKPYVEMTCAILQDFGIDVQINEAFDTFKLAGKQAYRGFETTVDGDWSATAFLLVAGMLAAETSIEIQGLNSLYPQADEAIRGALLFAGGALSGSDDGVQIAHRPVRAFNLDLTNSPDLFPPLAVLAAFAKKPSILRGASRLIHKESNRALALITEFKKLGISVEHDEAGDQLRIHPWNRVPASKPIRIASLGDHRMAMAAATLAIAGVGAIEIEDAECVAKSYPAFFDDLEVLGAQIEWVSQ
jgi:3-phosphoshikimate 1-carboxyvinyltransferase